MEAAGNTCGLAFFLQLARQAQEGQTHAPAMAF